MNQNSVENLDLEAIEALRRSEGLFGYSRTSHTPTNVPPLITKKWLCCHFGLITPKGQLQYRALYRKVLTADVVKACGLKMDEVRRQDLKTFDAVTSANLKRILML